MTPEEAADSLNELAKLIAESIPDLTQTAATTGKAKIQDRIQEKGLNAELVSFPDYSPKYKKKKSEKHDVSKRDLTLSGDMWRKTLVIETGATANGYEVIVGGSDTLTKSKMSGNAELIGDFLKPSEAEVKILKEDYDNQLQKIINKAGF